MRGKYGLAIENTIPIMHGSNWKVKHSLMCFLKFLPTLVYLVPLERIGVGWNMDPDCLIIAPFFLAITVFQKMVLYVALDE